MKLAHDVIGDGPRTVVFLHGILGSRNNWRSFAKKLVAARPAFRAVIADLRNHGDSHGFSPPHTVEACAGDVADLLPGLGAGDVVVGHSYGGKVALVCWRDHPAITAWILDAPPGPRALAGGSDVERVIAIVSSLPMPVESRRALVEQLRARGLSEPLAQWMTTNLREADGEGFVWRFDLTAIPEMLASFGALDLWPAVEHPPAGAAPLHLVRAARSDRFNDDDVARAERSPAAYHALPDAGHWLHTDNPEGLLALILGGTP